MSTHAGPTHPPIDGECSWSWHFSGVDMSCDSPAIPGCLLCAEHLVDAVAASDAAKKERR